MHKIQICYTNSSSINSNNLHNPARIRQEGSNYLLLHIRTICSPKNKPLRTIVGSVVAGIQTKPTLLYMRLQTNLKGKIL